MKILRGCIRFIKREGFRAFLVEAFRRILRAPHPVLKPKQTALNIVRDQFGNTVAYGLFKGMEFENNWWGGFDQISKILGVYELGVLQKLDTILDKDEKSTFIDIGAADGYYAVGVAYAGLADRVYAFELSPEGRKSIGLHARKNNCENKVLIQGEATYESLESALDSSLKTTVLIDIEGAEYELLNSQILSLLQQCYVIVELHPQFVEDGFTKERELLDRASQWFDVSKIYRGHYDPNAFECFNSLPDDTRLLALSEGRSKNPKWLLLEPNS